MRIRAVALLEEYQAPPHLTLVTPLQVILMKTMISSIIPFLTRVSAEELVKSIATTLITLHQFLGNPVTITKCDIPEHPTPHLFLLHLQLQTVPEVFNFLLIQTVF